MDLSIQIEKLQAEVDPNIYSVFLRTFSFCLDESDQITQNPAILKGAI